MTKRLIIFASTKGGVGKSYASRAFLDTARKSGRKVSTWDLDGATGSLALLYHNRNPEVGVATEDVRDERAPGAWIDALYGDAADVMLDVPGGALDDLERMLDGGASALVQEAKSAGREVVVVSVIGTKRDATAAPQDAIERFGTSVHHVVVKNGFFGEATDFVIYDGLPTPTAEAPQAKLYGRSAKIVHEAGGEVVYLPKLNPITDALLDNQNLSFVEGMEALEKLGRRHTANLRGWLSSVDRAFAGTWLCPAGEVPAAAAATKNGRARTTAVVE